MTRMLIEDALDFAAQRSPRPVTAAMLAAARGTTPESARQALNILIRKGLAERMSPGRFRPSEAGLALAREGGRIETGKAVGDPRRPGRDSLQARLWAALRKLRKGTVPDLVQIAGRGHERNPVANGGVYVRALVAAGYVRELPTREPGASPMSRGFKRYLLARDPGPRAPVLDKHRGRLRDPNTGAVIDLATGQELTP